jgi:hypothetical protein
VDTVRERQGRRTQGRKGTKGRKERKDLTTKDLTQIFPYKKHCYFSTGGIGGAREKWIKEDSVGGRKCRKEVQ